MSDTAFAKVIIFAWGALAIGACYGFDVGCTVFVSCILVNSIINDPRKWRH